jgi:hypothetical protein
MTRNMLRGPISYTQSNFAVASDYTSDERAKRDSIVRHCACERNCIVLAATERLCGATLVVVTRAFFFSWDFYFELLD